MINVLIVDDHPIVRQGTRSLLEDGSKEIRVIGEAANGQEAIQLTEILAPDVLLLDMDLPDINGIEVAAKVQESNADTEILVLSAHSDLYFVQGLLQTGISGYLIKDEAPELIIQAVCGVANGEKGWYSRKISARFPGLMKNDLGGHSGSVKISAREREVLLLVVAGKTNAEIAFQLGVSEKTVEKHLNTIFHKLGVVSRVEAAICAVRSGIA